MKRLALLACVAGFAACEGEDLVHAPRASLERMQEQLSYRPYARNEAFADGRAMRPPPTDSAPYAPHAAPVFVLDRAGIEEGRTLHDTFCAPCHGILGEGNTVVAQHMRYAKPTSLLSARVRGLSDARLAQVILGGYGMMAGMDDRLTAVQAHEIAYYVRALQLSQSVVATTISQDLRAQLEKM